MNKKEFVENIANSTTHNSTGIYEELIIENFFNLSATIQFSDFNCLTGANATGKTVVMKLLYFFQTYFKYFYEYLYEDLMGSTKQSNREDEDRNVYITKKLRGYFRDFFPGFKSVNKQFSIIYKLINNGNLLEIIVNYQDEKLDFSTDLIEVGQESTSTTNITNSEINTDEPFFSERLGKGVNAMINAFSGEDNFQLSHKELQKVLTVSGPSKGQKEAFIWQLMYNAIYLVETFFVPAERTKFLNSFTYTSLPIDHKLYEFLKNNFEETGEKKFSEVLCPFANELNIGDSYYIDEDHRLFVFNDYQEKVSIESASTGQRDHIILLVIFDIIYTLQEKNNQDLIILFMEEPGNYLFPNGIIEFIKSLVLLFNKSKEGGDTKLRVYLTTHNPFVIGSLNVFYYNGLIRQQDKGRLEEVEVKELSPYLNKETLSAYGLIKNKKNKTVTAKNIMDSDTGILEEEFIGADRTLREYIRRAEELEEKLNRNN